MEKNLSSLKGFKPGKAVKADLIGSSNSEAAKAAFRVAVKVAQIGKLTPLEKRLIVGIENCLNTRYKEFVREFKDWDVQEYVIIQAAKDCPGINFSFSEKTQTFKINL